MDVQTDDSLTNTVVPSETPEPTRKFPWPTIRDGLAVVVLALTLNLLGNGRISLWDRDEPRYAACVREMRASGDYIHPTFNAEPRYHKPALIYWLMLGGTALGGDNPFGARLVSAIFGAGTSVLVWWFGRGLFGPRGGLWAGLVLATSPIMIAESKLSTTDATLAFWLVGCQIALWTLSQRDSVRAAAAFWVCLALATMTKGPVGLGIIAVSGIASWWFCGPLECWKRLRWKPGVLAFLALTAPWYIAIGIRSNGEFYRVAMGYHVIRRMTTGIEQHGHFPGYYPVLSIVTFFPWSALIPVAMLAAWRRRKSDPRFGFLLGWVIGPLVMFEAVQTKLIHYFLPAYPACALLVAWVIEAVAQDEVNIRRWPLGRLAVGLLAGVGLSLAVGLAAGAFVVPAALKAPSLVLAVVIAGGTIYAIDRLTRARTERGAAVLAVTWAAVGLLLCGWFLPASESVRISARVGKELRTLADRYHVTPAIGIFEEPGIIYAAGKPLPVVRTRTALLDTVKERGPLIVAIYPWEVDRFKTMPQLQVNLLQDKLEGFNTNKARHEVLRFAIIGPSSPRGLAAAPQQFQIK